MRSIRAIELAKQLGLARQTIWDICENDSRLAFKRNGSYYIRISELAKKPGFDLVGAILSPHGKWIKAVELAKKYGVPRRTMSNWCLTRPNFAKRIGRIWYVDLELLGATESQVDELESFRPVRRGQK